MYLLDAYKTAVAALKYLAQINPRHNLERRRRFTLLVVPKVAPKTRIKHSIQLLLDLSKCKPAEVESDI